MGSVVSAIMRISGGGLEEIGEEMGRWAANWEGNWRCGQVTIKGQVGLTCGGVRTVVIGP